MEVAILTVRNQNGVPVRCCTVLAAADPASLSPESELWADLAEHLAGGGGIGPDLYGARPDRTANRTAAFLPRRLESGGWTFTDCVLAVSVVSPSVRKRPAADHSGKCTLAV